MREQQAGLADLTPGQHLQFRAQAFDEGPLGLDGDGVLEPLRRGRLSAGIVGQRRLNLRRQFARFGVNRPVVVGGLFRPFRRLHVFRHLNLAIRMPRTNKRLKNGKR